MSDFYFDQFALNYLAQLIMALAITGYLLALRNKSGVTWLLTLVFLSIVLYAAVSLAGATAVWKRAFYAAHLQVVFASLIVVTLLQFAYRFPRTLPTLLIKQERQAALVISLLATTATAGWALYQFTELRPGGSPTTSTALTNIWLAIGFLWTVSVFWRQSYQLSRTQNSARTKWQHLLHPQGKQAQAAFVFALVPLLAAATALLLNIASSPMVRSIVSEFASSAVVLLTLFLLSVLYFNYAPERISFMARLIGISLVTVLLLLGMVGMFIAPAFINLLNVRRPAEFSQTLHFELQSDGTYTVTSLPLRLAPESEVEQTADIDTYPLPFSFPFFGQRWDEVRVRDIGLLVWDDWSANAYQYNLSPAVTVFRFGSQRNSRLFINSEAGRFVATWEIGPENSAVAQIVLYPDGAMDLNYDRVDGDLARRIGIQSGSGNNAFTPFEFDAVYDQTAVMADGLLTDFGIRRQQFLHQNLWPLVYIKLFAALFLIFVFPYFFHIILVRPLNRLVAGVRAVDAGDLQTQIPVQAQDEIGVITESFNRMVASVYANDQELESLVRTRTAQLATSEARYRKLFETMTSGVMVFSVGEDGRFFLRGFNRAGERFGSTNMESAIGRPLEELWPGSEAKKLGKLLEQVYQSEPLKQFPSLLLNREGTFWQEVTAYKLVPDEIVVVFDDVTDRLANEARQQRLAVLEERERIGRELHDDLGQVLGFVNVQSQATLTLLDKGDIEQARAALRQLADVTQDAHDDVREYILGIRHEDIRKRGNFFDILARYLDLLDSRYGLKVQVSIPQDWQGDSDYRPRVFAPEVETQLLRIIQEALTNVRKYASVKEADLFFTQHGDSAQILIGDKGPGFSPAYAQTAAEGHFGLDIMRERTEKVEGQLEIRSRPGSGTQVIVQMPLAAPHQGYNLVGVRVLLVDDHQLYLEGLRNLLTAKGMIVVGTATDGLEAQEAARQLRPELILMDVEMPEHNGLEATRIIKTELPDIRIVVLTVAADSETLFQAIKHGASGYLLKSLEGDAFFKLLAEVLAGETVLSPSMAAYILNDVVSGKSPDSAGSKSAPILTTRQMEVLNLIVQDKTNQEIGEALHISENTVKYHVRQILSQLHLRSRYELAVYAEEEGLLD